MVCVLFISILSHAHIEALDRLQPKYANTIAKVQSLSWHPAMINPLKNNKESRLQKFRTVTI
jgi:hypothetical protein